VRNHCHIKTNKGVEVRFSVVILGTPVDRREFSTLNNLPKFYLIIVEGVQKKPAD
jgi:hypothetical protein